MRSAHVSICNKPSDHRAHTIFVHHSGATAGLSGAQATRYNVNLQLCCASETCCCCCPTIRIESNKARMHAMHAQKAYNNVVEYNYLRIVHGWIFLLHESQPEIVHSLAIEIVWNVRHVLAICVSAMEYLWRLLQCICALEWPRFARCTPFDLILTPPPLHRLRFAPLYRLCDYASSAVMLFYFFCFFFVLNMPKCLPIHDALIICILRSMYIFHAECLSCVIQIKRRQNFTYGNWNCNAKRQQRTAAQRLIQHSAHISKY